MQLAWKIFVAILVANVIGWVGKKVLVDLFFALYSLIFLTSTARQSSTLKRSILSTKAELNATSSQDQFAKWAKLRRKMDKEMVELEKLNTTLSTSRSRFESTFSRISWILTFVLPYILVWYNRRSPVFYLPSGWAPSPIAWLMSSSSKKGLRHLARASVSTAAWSVVCRRVIATAEELCRDWLPASEEVWSKMASKGEAKSKSTAEGKRTLLEPVLASSEKFGSGKPKKE